MKNPVRFSLRIFSLIVVSSLLMVQISYTCSPAPDRFRPVYLTFDALRSAVRSEPARSLKDPGKIMVKDQWIFVSERFEGVHIIDNSDPTSPRGIAFIRVPGNIDLAMKENILYADSYVDLVAIDVNNPAEAFATGRLENIYPNEPLVEEEIFWSEEIDPTKGVVIGKELVESSGGSCGGGGGGDSSGFGCSGGGGGGAASPAAAPPPDQSTGVNGSLARITIVEDHLYLLAGSSLKTVSIIDQAHPVYLNAIALGSDIETLYPYEKALFVGGQTGVQIIDITSPDDPTPLSRFQHPWQCDPIVVSGGIGYVTLRGGDRCGFGDNRLDILDVSDLSAPVLIKSYPLMEPYGIAVDANTLFVAEGSFGFRVFKVEDPFNLIEISSFPGRSAQDVILYERRAHIVGPNGLYQYDYSKLDDILFLSHVPVVP